MSGAQARDLAALSCSDFSSRLGEAFQIALPSGESLETRLAEATEHPHLPPQAGRRRGFSIVLQSGLPGALPQAIYRVTHAELGVLELFLVPIGPRGPGMRYEAVFN